MNNETITSYKIELEDVNDQEFISFIISDNDKKLIRGTFIIYLNNKIIIKSMNYVTQIKNNRSIQRIVIQSLTEFLMNKYNLEITWIAESGNLKFVPMITLLLECGYIISDISRTNKGDFLILIYQTNKKIERWV